MTRCRRLPDFGLTLEADAAPPKKADETAADEDDDALMPFGVDIGDALAMPFGFATAGIRGNGQAFVALISDHGSHRVDLGELHGDAETPALAAVGPRVIVALRSTDAAGFTLRLGSVTGPDSTAVDWGYELSKLGKTVTGVEVAASGARGVVVYQGEEKSGASRLMLGAFATDGLKEAFEVKALDVKDAEMPRLTRRSGGFWLTWAHTLPDPKKPVKTPPDAGVSDPEEAELLDVGLRVLEVAKLDEQGKVLGSSRRVGEPRRQVLLYDVAPLGPDGLLVAARSDSAAPGAEDGALVLSEVAPDGTVHERRLDDDELGVGAPSLLVESDCQAPGPWLVTSAPNDMTRLGLASGDAPALRSDPLLGHGQVVAVSNQHFLVQRARGRSVTLEALDCDLWRDATPSPPPADAEKK